MSRRVTSALWLTWTVLFGTITLHLFQWHIDYFKSPGIVFYRMALVVLPGLILASSIYSLLRQKAFLRYEAIAFALLPALGGFIYEPKAALIVLLFFLACCAAGRFALRKCGLSLDGSLESIVVGFGAGAGIFIVILFVAGLAGFFNSSTFAVFLILPVAMFWRDVWRTLLDFRALGNRWRAAPEALHPLAGVAVVFALLAEVCALMIALAPSLAFDSIAFHLPEVQYYAATHALRIVPGIDYSYYPQGMELIWTLGYSLGGQAAAQMTAALFFALFALLVLLLAGTCGLTEGAAVLAAAFTVTMPFLHWSGSVLKNDLALAFFLGLALLAFLRWIEKRSFRWIVAGTFFLALSFSIKLVALFALIPLALFYGYAAWREPRRWTAAGGLVLIFLLFGTWWMVRAWWLTGNPVAPETLGAAVGKYAGTRTFGGNLLRDAEIPWRLIFDGQRYFESPLPSPAGVILLAFSPLLLRFLGTGRTRPGWLRNRAPVACGIFAALYLIYWVIAVRKLRYAVLPFGLISIWIAAQVWRFYQSQSRATRVSMIAVAAYSFTMATAGLMIVGINGPQFGYFSGRLDKGGYLRSAMTPYGAVEFLKQTAPAARIFGVETLARGYSADPSRFEGIFCPEREPCDARKTLDAVRAFGAEYVILPENGKAPPELILRLGSPRRVYADANYSVYQLSR